MERDLKYFRRTPTFFFPFLLAQDFEGVSVDYITVPGWKKPIVDCRKFEDLPDNAQSYVNKIQELLGIKGRKHFCLDIPLGLFR